LEVPRGVELVELAAIGSLDAGGSQLVSLEPGVAVSEVWERRRETLFALLEELEPAAVLIELFPLGRRKFADELLPFLEAARRLASAPAILCSVRDILVANGPDQQRRDDEAAQRLAAHFDAVIVHADQRFVALEETFRPSTPIPVPVLYSGFVARPSTRPPVDALGPAQIVVSAGGGKTGGPLLRTVAEAHRRHFRLRGLRTRIITGPFLTSAEYDELLAVAATTERLTVVRFVPDLAAAMAEATVSISQCGYNTALDIIRARVPSLVVPFDGGRETEQAERARRLAEVGVVRVLSMDELSVAGVLDAVDALVARTPVTVALDLNGAENTADIVTELVRTRRSLVPAS
jgi:predicted glycosyltransferase